MWRRLSAIVVIGALWPVATARAGTVCTVLGDAATGKVLKQEGTCEARATPASTFKIAISLMGYDAGFLQDEHTPALPFREGYPDWLPEWRATTDPSRWMQSSVVWYSQQVTSALGDARFRRYVTAFRYGNQDASGDPGQRNGLTRAWLSSSLRISPLEQISFLSRVVARQLPIDTRAVDMTGRLIAAGGLPNGWQVHGKTGTGASMRTDGSYDRGRSIGWYVGWATKNGRTVVFAHLIRDTRDEPVRAGLRARDEFLRALPALLDSL